jgi:hypothetical protein
MKWTLGVLCLLLSGVMTVEAHRLTVDWVYADGVIELHARAGTEAAVGAELQLFDASGTVLVEDVLDEGGRYRWPLSGGGPYTIVINAGLGHRRTLTLSETELRSDSTDAAERTASPASDPGPTREPGSRTGGSSDAALSETVRVGLGLTFLLALAAAWTSYRNSRRLTDLERRLDRHEG